MVVGGVPIAVSSHAERVANFALGMILAAREVINPVTGGPIQVQHCLDCISQIRSGGEVINYIYSRTVLKYKFEILLLEYFHFMMLYTLPHFCTIYSTTFTYFLFYFFTICMVVTCYFADSDFTHIISDQLLTYNVLLQIKLPNTT